MDIDDGVGYYFDESCLGLNARTQPKLLRIKHGMILAAIRQAKKGLPPTVGEIIASVATYRDRMFNRFRDEPAALAQLCALLDEFLAAPAETLQAMVVARVIKTM